MTTQLNKRERLKATLRGDSVDRVPTAVWRHFPGDDQRAADLATSVLAYQAQYNWDFVNLMPANNYSVIDHGVQDAWQGDTEGRRVILRHPVTRSLDWTELRVLDPGRGALARQITAIGSIQQNLQDQDTPLIVTVYSPLAQAARLAGEDLLRRHMRRRADRLTTGLKALAEGTLLFVEALRKSGVDGIYYVIEHADDDRLSPAEYEHFGLPDDQHILNALPESWWLNIAYIQGQAPMFDMAARLPVAALNWQDRRSEPDLVSGRAAFGRSVCGGLDAESELRAGTPSMVANTARNAIAALNSRRLILSPGGPVPITTPRSNLAALRDAVEKVTV